MPILYLLAGTNGSGKSTFYEHVIGRAAPRLEFVNADEIERLAKRSGEQIDSYEASTRAAERRTVLMTDRRSFVTETVFSHPSKVDLIEAAVTAGYIVSLHVMIIPLAVSIARFRERAELGGHNVAVDKMTALDQRLWDLIATAIGCATDATVWDSSGFSEFVKVAQYERGHLVGAPAWPSWTPAPLRLGPPPP